MLAIKKGGLSPSEADRHLLKQFCRGCWDNALISEFQLQQRKTSPSFLRTFTAVAKHLGASKQRASSYSLCVSTDEAVTTQAIVSDLKKQITELQSQVESLKKAKKQTTGSHENMLVTCRGRLQSCKFSLLLLSQQSQKSKVCWKIEQITVCANKPW